MAAFGSSEGLSLVIVPEHRPLTMKLTILYYDVRAIQSLSLKEISHFSSTLVLIFEMLSYSSGVGRTVASVDRGEAGAVWEVLSQVCGKMLSLISFWNSEVYFCNRTLRKLKQRIYKVSYFDSFKTYFWLANPPGFAQS